MPLAGRSQLAAVERPYFSSLKDLDAWAAAPEKRLNGVLEYVPRRLNESAERGKLLVCHDYKGGYTESPFALSYTFNFWSSCDIFVYFSHHRVTIPPPGWITAAHRQGVKILGTLIFERGGEEDCLRLLVGNLPASRTGPARTSSGFSLPLSPHYAIVLADLAAQRGFDGYLLNFECPLQGGMEQARVLAAWITILQAEILAKVGSHGETIWYDSVIFTGQLAWQDRLNSLNLPFFLSSTALFTNYTWPRDYPNLTAQYFLTLDPALTGNAPDSQPGISKKSLNDIYTGVDVWGRGSHGGGGFGSYKAITHVSPESLGLSVALFGQAWTWESEQDKPGFDWNRWWEYESKLWVGPVSGTVHVPEAPRREGEPECIHGPFVPIRSFFPGNPAPDPYGRPLHTTFCPGVGRGWFVEGAKVHQSDDGWTDIDKQCTIGDMVWPCPILEWEGGERHDRVLDAVSAIYMDDAWNGGSSLRLSLSSPGSEADDDVYRCVWLPIQSLALTPRKGYEATVVYKVESDLDTVDLGLSVKLTSGITGTVEVTPVATADTQLPGGWGKLSIRFTVTQNQDASPPITGTIGLIIAVIAEEPSQALHLPILLGQLNVYPTLSAPAAAHIPLILWADYTSSGGNAPLSGTLTWEVAASLPPLTGSTISSPEDPVSAWNVQASNMWFPTFHYFNIYALRHSVGGGVGQPEDAAWIGTTGLDGKRNSFAIVQDNVPFFSVGTLEEMKVRFYVQGVTDRGDVLRWDQCMFVDYYTSANRRGV